VTREAAIGRLVENKLFIVRNEGQYHGPFLEGEAGLFASKLKGASDIVPLLVPRLDDEKRGPMQLQLLKADAYRAHVDSAKVDTHHMLAGSIEECFFARREERVFTVREICDLWDSLIRVSLAVESLMHYADQAVESPSADNMEALRKAVWRNRNSDDVDPHYRDRFW
jgi:hypothetical protein